MKTLVILAGKNRDLYAGIVDGKNAVVYAVNKCQLMEKAL